MNKNYTTLERNLIFASFFSLIAGFTAGNIISYLPNKYEDSKYYQAYVDSNKNLEKLDPSNIENIDFARKNIEKLSKDVDVIGYKNIEESKSKDAEICLLGGFASAASLIFLETKIEHKRRKRNVRD